MANEIITEIRLELDKFRADLKESEKLGAASAAKSGKEMGDGIEKGLGSVVGGLKGVVLALGAAFASAITFKESIAAAMEQETAIKSLNSALALTGNYTEAGSKQFLEFAGALQKSTGAADEAITQGAALLVTMGKLSGEGLERATQASLDLAAGLNIDLGTAFNMIGKAASGNVGALNRYGLSIKDTGDNAKDFANALGVVEARMKGMAELQSGTFAGSLSKVKSQFGEVLESLGNIVIQSPTSIAILKFMASTFESLAAAITKFASGKDLVKELSLVLVEMGLVISTYVLAPLELLYNAGVVVFKGITLVVQQTMVDIVTAVGWVTGALAGFGGKFAEANEAVLAFKDSTSAVLVDLENETKDAASNIFNFDKTQASENMLEGMKEVINNVKPTIVDAFKDIKGAATEQINGITFAQVIASMKDLGAKVKIESIDIAKTINTWLIQTTVSAFSQFGAALAKGENAFAAFGKSVLASLGQILIQFGTMLITVGAGLATVPMLFGLSGPAAIVAGIAAVVAGGALTALAGGGGGGAAASAPSSGGVSTSGGGVAVSDMSGMSPAADMGQDFVEQKVDEKKTNVTVQVMGNVFDRRETGFQIAEVMNEVFSNGGVVLATG